MKTILQSAHMPINAILICMCFLFYNSSSAETNFLVLTIDAGIDATICAGSTHNLNASTTCTHPSNAYLWTTSGSGSFTPNDALISVYTPSAADITAGTVNLTLTQTGGGQCTNVSGSLTLTISPNSTASAGNAQTICQGSITASLGGVIGGGTTTGIWSSNSGGTFSPNNTTLLATWTPPAGFSGGAILTLTATGVSAPCIATATVNITVRPTPTVSVGGSQTICQNGATTGLGGQVGGSATSGTWTSNNGGSFLPNATTPSASWSAPPGFTGTATLTLTTTGMAPCLATSANVSVIVNPLPTASAGVSQTICQGGTTTGLGGIVGGSASGGTWSSNSGGTFNPNNTNLNATWSPPAGFSGIATLTLTTTGMAPCAAATTTVSITVNQAPTAATGSNQTICQGGTTSSLGGVIGGSAGSGTWSSSSGGTFNPNTTTLNATWTPPAGFTGSAVLTLTASGVLAPCNTATANITITVNNLPTANTGSAQTICQGSTTTGLGGIVGGSATGGTWSSSNGGTFNPNSNNLNATWTPPGGFSGNATLTLTTTGMAPCAAATATINVAVTPSPIASAGSNQTICQGGTTSGLGGAVGSSATGGTWSSNSGGSFNPNSTALNATWTPPVGFSGNATLTLTTTGMAPCAAATATVNINVNPSPTASTANNQTICQEGTTAALGGQIGGSATGGGWSSNSAGTFSPNANNLNATWTPPAGFSGLATLTLTTTGMQPCAAVTSELTINVTPTPTVSANSSQVICLGSSTTGLGGVIGGSATGGTWSSNSGGTFSPNENALDATWTPAAGFTGNVILTLTTTGMAPCAAAITNVSITVNPNLSAEVIYTGNPFCQELATNQIPQITGDAGGTFTTPTGLFIDDATGTIVPSQSTAGVYNIDYVIPGLIGCPDFIYPVEIIIAPAPSAILDANIPSYVCEESEVTISANGHLFSDYSTYEWQFLDVDNNPIGSFESGISPLDVVYSVESFTEETTIQVLLTEAIGTCSNTSVNQIVVRVQPEVCGLYELVGDVLAACSEVGSYYQWGCGQSAIQGENSNSFVHSAFSVLNSCEAFWVEVSLYSDFSCSIYMGDLSQLTSIADEGPQNTIIVYPNPASSILNLSMESGLSVNSTYEVITIDGKQISSGNIQAGTTHSSIDINQLTSGNYFLSIAIGNSKNVIPFIVSR